MPSFSNTAYLAPRPVGRSYVLANGTGKAPGCRKGTIHHTTPQQPHHARWCEVLQNQRGLTLPSG